jgi:hypothetical protein
VAREIKTVQVTPKTPKVQVEAKPVQLKPAPTLTKPPVVPAQEAPPAPLKRAEVKVRTRGLSMVPPPLAPEAPRAPVEFVIPEIDREAFATRPIPPPKAVKVWSTGIHPVQDHVALAPGANLIAAK